MQTPGSRQDVAGVPNERRGRNMDGGMAINIGIIQHVHTWAVSLKFSL